MTPDDLVAQLEVRNLLGLLAQRADAGDTDGYLGLMADDIVWSVPAIPTFGIAASDLHGKAEIAAAQATRMEAGVQGPGSNTMHVLSTCSVRVIDAMHAEATTYFHFLRRTDTEPTMANSGRYEDVFDAEAGPWLLRRRTIHMGSFQP